MFADTEAAQRLARLEADKELVFQLMLDGYEGAGWRAFASALAEYGLQVIRAWIRTGMIFHHCKKRGFGGLPSLKRTDDDAQELAAETVAVSINAFREKVLVPNRWDPTKGASLKTFFIGQCLLQFPNVYRHWMGEAAPERLEGLEADDTRSPRPSTATLVELARAVAALPPKSTMKMEAMIEMGYSQAEIAEIEGVSHRSVTSKLYRKRAGARREP